MKKKFKIKYIDDAGIIHLSFVKAKTLQKAVLRWCKDNRTTTNKMLAVPVDVKPGVIAYTTYSSNGIPTVTNEYYKHSSTRA